MILSGKVSVCFSVPTCVIFCLNINFSLHDVLQYWNIGRETTARNPTRFYKLILHLHSCIYLWISPAYGNPVNYRPRKLQCRAASADGDLLHQIIPNLKQVNFQEVLMSVLSIRDMVILSGVACRQAGLAFYTDMVSQVVLRYNPQQACNVPPVWEQLKGCLVGLGVCLTTLKWSFNLDLLLMVLISMFQKYRPPREWPQAGQRTAKTGIALGASQKWSREHRKQGREKVQSDRGNKLPPLPCTLTEQAKKNWKEKHKIPMSV